VTVLDFAGQQTGGTGANGISITGNGVTVEGLSIVDTDGDGIRATDVTDVVLRDLAVSWTTPADRDNGGYGVYPVGCAGVLVEGCTVSGASDTGIYVGQSTQVVVRDNEVFENVVGIEIENTRDSEVVRNHAHGNAGGILAFNLPNLPAQGGARAKIHDNEIVDNDGRNFADPANIVSMVPPGTGVFLLATDDNEVHGNVISGNDSIGVSILSYDPKLIGPFTDEAYDPYPTGNWVHDNEMADNGTSPDGLVEVLFADQNPFPDLSWDGCEDAALDNSDGRYTNCFSNNAGADYFFMDWCGGKAAQHNDPTDVTCEHDPLPVLEE
jgi:parallel beta-helix repeat protein